MLDKARVEFVNTSRKLSQVDASGQSGHEVTPRVIGPGPPVTHRGKERVDVAIDDDVVGVAVDLEWRVGLVPFGAACARVGVGRGRKQQSAACKQQ